jgi:hypothetical protein
LYCGKIPLSKEETVLFQSLPTPEAGPTTVKSFRFGLPNDVKGMFSFDVNMELRSDGLYAISNDHSLGDNQIVTRICDVSQLSGLSLEIGQNAVFLCLDRVGLAMSRQCKIVCNLDILRQNVNRFFCLTKDTCDLHAVLSSLSDDLHQDEVFALPVTKITADTFLPFKFEAELYGGKFNSILKQTVASDAKIKRPAQISTKDNCLILEGQVFLQSVAYHHCPKPEKKKSDYPSNSMIKIIDDNAKETAVYCEFASGVYGGRDNGDAEKAEYFEKRSDAVLAKLKAQYTQHTSKTIDSLQKNDNGFDKTRNAHLKNLSQLLVLLANHWSVVRVCQGEEAVAPNLHFFEKEGVDVDDGSRFGFTDLVVLAKKVFTLQTTPHNDEARNFLRQFSLVDSSTTKKRSLLEAADPRPPKKKAKPKPKAAPTVAQTAPVASPPPVASPAASPAASPPPAASPAISPQASKTKSGPSSSLPTATASNKHLDTMKEQIAVLKRKRLVEHSTARAVLEQKEILLKSEKQALEARISREKEEDDFKFKTATAVHHKRAAAAAVPVNGKN